MGEGKVAVRCAICGTETDEWLERAGKKLCSKCYMWEESMAESVGRGE